MSYRSLDHLLDALGEGIAIRMPAADPCAMGQSTAVARAGSRLPTRLLRTAGFAVAPLLVLAFLLREDMIAFVPVYLAILLTLRVRDALRTALSWAVGWGALALGFQALFLRPQPGSAPFIASAGSLSVLVGLLGFLTGGLFVGVRHLVYRGRAPSDLIVARMAWWGAGIGAAVSGLLVASAFVLGATVESWFIPTAVLALGTCGAVSAAVSTKLAQLTDEGHVWPTRLRNALGWSLSWGLAYGLFGLIAGIPQWLVVGLISGAGFSLVLAIAERQGHVEELTLGRVSVAGAIGAALSVAVALPLFLVMSSSLAGFGILYFLTMVAVLGAGAACATLAIARRLGVRQPARPRERISLLGEE